MPETAADETLEVPTASGPAGVRLTLGGGAGLLCLGHGAGGGTDAPDLLAVTGAATAAGWTVARIDQPYRVAGRRAPAPAPRLDEAWITIVAALRGRFADPPLVTGGRRRGARGPRPPAGHRRAQQRRPVRLPYGDRVRRRGGRVPGLPAGPAGATGEVAVARAPWSRRTGPRRPGGAGPVRRAAGLSGWH